MAYRVPEVTLLSAKDLKNVNLITRMAVYAVATISGDPITRQCTAPDPNGGRHPTWNETLRFKVPPTAAKAATGCLHVLLRAERSLGDRDVGEVIVPLAEILAGAGPGDLGPRPQQFASFQVHKVHRTEMRGVLYLSYRLGPVVAPPPQAVPKATTGEPVFAPTIQVQLVPTHPQAAGPVAVSPPAKPVAGPGHAPVPSPPKPAVHAAVPPSEKPAVQAAVPPSPKHSGYVAVPSPAKPAVPPSPKYSGDVAVPLSAKQSGHAAMPPSPKPAGHLTVPPSPIPSGHAVPSSPKPAGQVAMPPSPKPAGHVAVPPSPIPSGHAVSSPAEQAGQVAITFSPEAPFARSRKEAGSKTYGRDVVTSYMQ